MDGMSEQDRQAVLLRYYEGKSYVDIGARLGLR
jgi:DNA-directed RNA polymerase specialized sigma24 family protein